MDISNPQVYLLTTAGSSFYNTYSTLANGLILKVLPHRPLYSDSNVPNLSPSHTWSQGRLVIYGIKNLSSYIHNVCYRQKMEADIDTISPAFLAMGFVMLQTTTRLRLLSDTIPD